VKLAFLECMGSNQKNATETLEIRSDGTFTKSILISRVILGKGKFFSRLELGWTQIDLVRFIKHLSKSDIVLPHSPLNPFHLSRVTTISYTY